MIVHSLLKSAATARLAAGFLILVAGSANLFAVGQRLPSSHVPAVVASGKIAPLGRLPSTNILRLALALPLQNTGALTNLLRDLYDPASPQFHRYLTPAEFTARFGPTPADYAAVIRFAKTNGLTVEAKHPNRLLVDVSGSVSAVERAFQVRLNAYRHPLESRNFYAPAAEPLVPATLPVLHIGGLDNFSQPHANLHLRAGGTKANAVPQGGSAPSGAFWGNDFRQAYVPGTTLTGAGQNVALLQFDGFYPADLTNYANGIGLTTNAPKIVVVPVDGGVSSPGTENNEVALDIEMVMSMAPGVSNIYVYEAPNGAPWEDLLNQMANDNLARQLSSSWAGGGPNPAAELIFQQMAAQGQSFFNASGDSDALIGSLPFPDESPNITLVGGTTLTTDTNGDYVSETVWNWGYNWIAGGYVGSSGGISPTVPIPVWQLGVDMTASKGSTLLRNIPDVALTGDNVYVAYDNGTNAIVGGTSCAAPLWAGLTALINQQAAQLGQPPVGFLNPEIYALGRGTNYAALFHDITAGDNVTPYSSSNFPAVAGFDLCTGWGTPAGTNLINALAMPDSLGISPAVVFQASGWVGGPFTATNWTVTLTNASAAVLGWSLGNVPAWLAVSATSGSLPANGLASLNLQLTGAETLPAGIYTAAITVTNLALSRSQIVAVQLNTGQSIVQNGSFETGDFTGWNFSGDYVIGTLIYNVVATDADFPGLVHSGNFGAFLGESGFLATLTQSLATTPGQKYLVSCWLNNISTGAGQQFVGSWNGTNFVNLVAPPVLTWTNILFLATATGTNTQLEFGAENAANYFGFDDVSVTPVPPVRFAGFAAGTNQFSLTWNSLAGLNYQLQCQTNLLAGGWINLGTITAVTNTAVFVDTNFANGAAARFYRLVLMP